MFAIKCTSLSFNAQCTLCARAVRSDVSGCQDTVGDYMENVNTGVSYESVPYAKEEENAENPITLSTVLMLTICTHIQHYGSSNLDILICFDFFYTALIFIFTI
jgi:uncharacterized FlgJ-related protein